MAGDDDDEQMVTKPFKFVTGEWGSNPESLSCQCTHTRYSWYALSILQTLPEARAFSVSSIDEVLQGNRHNNTAKANHLHPTQASTPASPIKISTLATDHPQFPCPNLPNR